MYLAYADGSLKDGIASAGYIIFKNEEYVLHKRKTVATSGSNTLEYIALLELLREINKLKLSNVKVLTDSKSLLVDLEKIQNGKKVKNKITRDIEREFFKFSNRKIERIKSSQNKAHKVCRGEYVAPVVEPIPIVPVEMIREDAPSKLKNKKKELRMVVRYRPHILMRCPVCFEHKAATEYPRYKKGRSRRNCNVCESKLNLIHSV